MYKLTKPLFLHCQTPTHVGSGSDLGIIDLPIQRERHTQFPKFESSSLKGALRQRFEEVYSDINDRVKIHLAFGYDDAGENEDVKKKFKGKDEKAFEPQFAGALGITDARILFFPVKSMRGVFALVTCPYVLKKFAEELLLTQNEDPNVTSLKTVVTTLEASSKEGFCYTDSSELKIKDQNAVVLEEYAFTVNDFKDLAQLTEVLQKIVGIDLNKIVILHNDDFADFVTLHTEVITRNKIDNKLGTVDKKIGGLFSEEFLPAETILYSLVMASPVFQTQDHDFKEPQKVMNFFTETVTEKACGIFQIGGNTTLGKGIVKLHI